MNDLINSSRYVDPTSDSGFKAIFGDKENKPILIALLNSILPPDRHVRQLDFCDREIIGFTPDNKTVHLDLRCIDAQGRQFLVEMQKVPHDNFLVRSFCYSASALVSSYIKGDFEFKKIKPVYTICLMARSPEDPLLRGDNILKHCSFYDLEEAKDLGNKTINLTFVRMYKARKTFSKDMSDIEKFCCLMNQIANYTDCPAEIAEEIGFRSFFDAAEVARFNSDKKLKYVHDMMIEGEYEYRIKKAAEKAAEKAAQEAAREAAEKATREALENTVRRMLAKGKPVEDIIDATELSEAEILDIKARLQQG